jgi:hypothetical protein
MRVYQLSLIFVIAFCFSYAADASPAPTRKPIARTTAKPSIKQLTQKPSAKPTNKLPAKPTVKVRNSKYEFC